MAKRSKPARATPDHGFKAGDIVGVPNEPTRFIVDDDPYRHTGYLHCYLATSQTGSVCDPPEKRELQIRDALYRSLILIESGAERGEEECARAYQNEYGYYVSITEN